MVAPPEATQTPPDGDDQGTELGGGVAGGGLAEARLAPYTARLGAFTFDALLAASVPLVLMVLGKLTLPATSLPWWLIAVVGTVTVLAAASGTSVWVTGGLTPGKAIMGLRERRITTPAAPDPAPPKLVWAITRHSAGYLIIDILGIGALLTFFSPRRRCLHDIVFGSEVVHQPLPTTGPATRKNLLQAYAQRVEEGSQHVAERHGWLLGFLKWYIRIVLAISGPLLFLIKTQPAAAATPTLATTAPAATLGTVATTAIVIPTAVATGVAVTAIEVEPSPTFPAVAQLPPAGDGYPLGSPGEVTVRLEGGEPLSDQEALDYYRGFDGGAAERRVARVEYEGVQASLGDVIVPVSYPRELLRQNVGTFTIEEVSSDAPTSLVPAGTAAWPSCTYTTSGGSIEGWESGDTVGGWEYTGEPGEVTVQLKFESTGSSVADIGILLRFEGPADVVYFPDFAPYVDDDLNDRCTPLERASTTWATGAAVSEP